MTGGPILTCSGIAKAFAGVHAVRDVSVALGPGRTLGLIGQNGAGKSTLMNIVGGVVQPDSGTMTLDGRPYAPRSPGDAIAGRIAFIHQELNLFSNLSIAENIFLTDFPRRRVGPWSLIDRAATRKRTAELLAAVALDLAPETPVERLSPGERQLVEIAKAVRLDARVMIFDEPTTSLTPRETDRLFGLIERLRAAGRSMIYISHILGDVMRLCDDIAILRDGELVAAGPRSGFTVAAAIAGMVGRPIDQLYPPRRSAPGERILLEVSALAAAGSVKDVSFSLRAGEVLGVFGLMGSGRTELARILFGLDPHDAGSVATPGGAVGQSPRTSIRNRIAFVTENRREEGLMMNAAIGDNIALAALSRYAVTPVEFLESGRLGRAAADLGAALGIKARSFDQPARALSGGNQQKVVIAKWLMTDPAIFLLDEPTRGIDVGAKYEIYAIIERLAAAGGGVFFISSELDELLAMSDRILVMSRGEIVAEFARAAFDRGRILAAAFREEGMAA